MKSFELRINPQGKIQSIYNDALQPYLTRLGSVNVTRASEVEFEQGGWTVRAKHDPNIFLAYPDGSIKVFALREDALKAEVAAFWNLVPK